jgi:hypothetical protein
MNAPFGGRPESQSLWDSRRLWSLWDMLNFNLFGFWEATKIVSATITMGASQGLQNAGLVSEPQRLFIRNRFDYIAHVCTPLLMEKTDARLIRISIMLNRQYTYGEVVKEFQTLLEAIEDDIKSEGFYHYKHTKAILVARIPGDWNRTIAAFPSAKNDIEEAVDCYAMEHETACVFHLMRVLEHGLRELAGAVNLTFDVQQWHNIIDKIESAIRGIGDKWSASLVKSDWMQFYSESARHFFFLKEAWRNHVSHNRATYDETSAKAAMEHVRDFMNHLSSRLSETP